MKLMIRLFCIFALIVTIGAPPVNEKANEKDKVAAQKGDTKDDQDDAVKKKYSL